MDARVAAGPQVSWFNPASSAPLGSENLTSGQVALSADGSMLAAAAGNNTAVNLYATSSGALSNAFATTFRRHFAAHILFEVLLS